MKEWNPRFVCYARSNGKTPEEMIEHDREEYAGGCMLGFVLWNTQKWREFIALTGIDSYYKSQEDHDNYDKWLEKETQCSKNCGS